MSFTQFKKFRPKNSDQKILSLVKPSHLGSYIWSRYFYVSEFFYMLARLSKDPRNHLILYKAWISGRLPVEFSLVFVDKKLQFDLRFHSGANWVFSSEQSKQCISAFIGTLDLLGNFVLYRSAIVNRSILNNGKELVNMMTFWTRSFSISESLLSKNLSSRFQKHISKQILEQLSIIGLRY